MSVAVSQGRGGVIFSLRLFFFSRIVHRVQGTAISFRKWHELLQHKVKNLNQIRKRGCYGTRKAHFHAKQFNRCENVYLLTETLYFRDKNPPAGSGLIDRPLIRGLVLSHIVACLLPGGSAVPALCSLGGFPAGGGEWVSPAHPPSASCA